MNTNSKYDRIGVVRELERKGLHAKYYHGTQVISHFEANEHVVLGLKVLGMLDFLGTRVIRKHYGHGNKNGILHKDRKYRSNHHKDQETVYAWFSTSEDAAKWVEEQKKNPRLGFKIQKCEIFPTEDMAYRACVSGNGAI